MLTGCGKKDEWVVTQYADQSGCQGMFYSISNEAQDKLILVDGGWEQNAGQVRDVIKQYGNHVDAWIITHFHNDHVGAANVILDEPGSITIDKIYDSLFDYEQYMALAQEWDLPEYYENYLIVTDGIYNVAHVKRGDIVNFDGLSIEFFNCYDSEVSDIKDVLNNGALAFKVMAKEESFLFLSDVHNTETVNVISEHFSDKIPSTYVQAGHHGNSTIPDYFYDNVSPKKMFLDAPTELIENEDLRFGDLVNDYLAERGIEYVCYSTAPNQVTLK